MSCWHPSFSRSSPNCSIIPHRLHLPYGFLMMYRISAHLATSSIHPVSIAISVRTVGISPRTSFSTARYLPAVASCPLHGHSPLQGKHYRVWLISLTAVCCFVLQVWDSSSSRLRADFHRSAHIASVVPKKNTPGSRRRCFRSLVSGHTYLMTSLYEKLAYSQIFF